MPKVSFDPTAELLELKNLKPRVSIAFCRSNLARMSVKQDKIKMNYGAAASGSGKGYSSSNPTVYYSNASGTEVVRDSKPIIGKERDGSLRARSACKFF